MKKQHIFAVSSSGDGYHHYLSTNPKKFLTHIKKVFNMYFEDGAKLLVWNKDSFSTVEIPLTDKNIIQSMKDCIEKESYSACTIKTLDGYELEIIRHELL